MKKSDPFKAALKSFNAKALVSVNAALRATEHTADFAAVSLLDIAGFFNRGLIPSARSFEEISSKDLPPQQARDILYEISRAVVSSRQEAFVAHLKKPSSFDSSMMMSLDELHASVGEDGKIPGSIFGEVLLPSDPENYLLFTADVPFPENPYCTQEQLHATLTPGARPLARSHLYIDGELVLSYKNILYTYGHILRKFIRIHGFRLPARVPVVARYREDMNELLEYLLKVFPPYIEGHYKGRFPQRVPYRIVPFKDRPLAVVNR